MHELGIARGILETVREHLPAGRSSDLEAVSVRVGRLAGVVTSSLCFCFDALVEGTEMEGARLLVEDVPLSLACRNCGRTTEASAPVFRCAACGGRDLDLVAGEELEVVALELREEVPIS